MLFFVRPHPHHLLRQLCLSTPTDCSLHPVFHSATSHRPAFTTIPLSSFSPSQFPSRLIHPSVTSLPGRLRHHSQVLYEHQPFHRYYSCCQTPCPDSYPTMCFSHKHQLIPGCQTVPSIQLLQAHNSFFVTSQRSTSPTSQSPAHNIHCWSPSHQTQW